MASLNSIASLDAAMVLRNSMRCRTFGTIGSDSSMSSDGKLHATPGDDAILA